VYITDAIRIDEKDLEECFVRASGPGGQNVNKVASAVQLRFDLAGTQALSDTVKARMRELAGQRLNEDGTILIIARRHRTQDQNRRDAMERLYALIEQASFVPKVRHATKPTRSSRERRLEGKKVRTATKKLRKRVSFDD
jgi:ribosome-associated protein